MLLDAAAAVVGESRKYSSDAQEHRRKIITSKASNYMQHGTYCKCLLNVCKTVSNEQ